MHSRNIRRIAVARANGSRSPVLRYFLRCNRTYVAESQEQPSPKLESEIFGERVSFVRHDTECAGRIQVVKFTRANCIAETFHLRVLSTEFENESWHWFYGKRYKIILIDLLLRSYFRYNNHPDFLSSYYNNFTVLYKVGRNATTFSTNSSSLVFPNTSNDDRRMYMTHV